MKCSEFKRLLERAVSFRSSECRRDDEGWTRYFLPVLDAAPDRSVKNLAKAVNVAPSQGRADYSEVKNLCLFLEALTLLLADQAKASTIAEVSELTSALRRRSTSDLAMLCEDLSKPKKHAKTSKPKNTAPLRDEVVLRYSRRLEEALGDDEGFNSAFSALESDDELSVGEVTAIAKKFTNSAPKSRPAALKKIFARHHAIMVSRAKSAATAGRIAG